MENDWQTWGALGVVISTAAVFVWRLFRRSKKSGGCGSGCGSK